MKQDPSVKNVLNFPGAMRTIGRKVKAKSKNNNPMIKNAPAA